MYKVTKEFSYSIAHRIMGHAGDCSFIHGHTLRLFVTLHETNLNSEGMIMDFKDLKELVHTVIGKYLDHSLILSYHDPLTSTFQGIKRPEFNDFIKLYLLDASPTAENLSKHIYNLLAPKLFPTLYKVTVYETPSSYASYTL